MKPIQLILLAFVSITVSCYGQINGDSENKNKTVKIELPKYGFNDALVDQNGGLWFSSSESGVYYFKDNSFKNFNKANKLCTNNVNTIYEDHKGQIWFGTAKGLCRFDGNSFHAIRLPFQDTTSKWLDHVYPVINPNAVSAIIQDHENNYWIGTMGGGAYIYDGSHFESVLKNEGMTYDDSLQHNWISDISVDAKGDIWLASMSYGGLNLFDGKKFHSYYRKDGLSDDMIRTIFVAKNGSIYLGFNGNRASALTVFKNDSFHIFEKKRMACHRNVQAIFEDLDDKLWLGGMEGICILSDGNFNEFLNSDDTPFNGINFILSDLNNHIWFGGRHGLWKFDGNTIFKMSI